MDKLTQLARWIKSGGYFLEICAAFQSRPALYACGGRYITTPKTHPIKSSSAPVTTSTGLHLFINRAILCRTSTAAVASLQLCVRAARVGPFAGILQYASEQDGLGSFHSDVDSAAPGNSQHARQRHIQGKDLPRHLRSVCSLLFRRVIRISRL